MVLVKDRLKVFSIFVSVLVGEVCLLLGFFSVVGPMLAVMVASIAQPNKISKSHSGVKKWLVSKTFILKATELLKGTTMTIWKPVHKI